MARPRQMLLPVPREELSIASWKGVGAEACVYKTNVRNEYGRVQVVRRHPFRPHPQMLGGSCVGGGSAEPQRVT